MIRIKNLEFSYDKKSVLKDISLDIPSGSLVALMGENGSGKTTLIKNVLGSLKPKLGTIEVEGRVLDARENSKYFSYIPQEIRGVYNFHAIDLVLFGLAGEIALFKTPTKEQVARAEEVFKHLGIGYLMTRKIGEISGGERQMVLIARSLIRETPYLLMDEPTSSLDYRNQLLVMDTARTLADEGKTVIFSTHNPSFALSYSDHCIILKRGRLFASGPTDEVINEDNLEAIFNRRINIVNIDGKKIIYP